VIVDTAKECCGRVLSDHLDNQVTPSRMLLNEGRDVVDETRDKNEGTFGSLLLDWGDIRRSANEVWEIYVQLSQSTTGSSLLSGAHWRTS
jgi:hypothetical protein